MTELLKTSSSQIEVSILRVVRDDESTGRVDGWKTNKQRGGMFSSVPFSVFVRRGEMVNKNGCGIFHPKLVLRAASAAWLNGLGA